MRERLGGSGREGPLASRGSKLGKGAAGCSTHQGDVMTTQHSDVISNWGEVPVGWPNQLCGNWVRSFMRLRWVT